MTTALAAQVPLAQEQDLSMFGNDPLWLVLLKALALFAFLMLTVLLCIVMERKVLGWMQRRVGPNRHGPFGLLQSLADGVKLMLKEDIVVKGADKVLYILAPILATIPAIMALAVIPFGPSDDPVSIFGTQTVLQLTDLPVALLYVLATAAIAVYGTVLAGWSSGSTYPLLGGVRATAQVISYEVAMGLSFAAVFLYSGTMSTSGIVEAQEHRWFVVLLPVSFIIYMFAMVGESHRPPLDMPESEGDLVGGYLTEYSSIKFAFFMMSEYIHMVTVSMLMVTLFLGGWRAPAPISTWWPEANEGWWPLLWFVIKLLAVIFFFVWIRATLPRVRYDHFMVFGWKVLIPFALVWLMMVATVRALQNEGYSFADIVLWVSGAVLVLLLASFVVDLMRDRAQRAKAGTEPPPEPEFDPMAGGFPVPPKPGQSLPPVPRRPSRGQRPGGPAAGTATADPATAEPEDAAPGQQGDDHRDARKEDGDG